MSACSTHRLTFGRRPASGKRPRKPERMRHLGEGRPVHDQGRNFPWGKCQIVWGAMLSLATATISILEGQRSPSSALSGHAGTGIQARNEGGKTRNCYPSMSGMRRQFDAGVATVRTPPVAGILEQDFTCISRGRSPPNSARYADDFFDLLSVGGGGVRRV